MDFSFLLSFEYLAFLATTVACVANLGLILCAIKALGQISEQRNEIRLTRQRAAVDELRQFERFIDEASKVMEKIEVRQGKKGLYKACEMEHFTLEECGDQKFYSDYNIHKNFFDGNIDLYKESIVIANRLEVIATSLRYGVADFEIVRSAIGPAFCEFVEDNFYIYVTNRTASNPLYPSTIEMYKRLKPEVKTQDQNTKSLDEQMWRLFKLTRRTEK